MKEYTFENVTYSYSRNNRKWKFSFGTNTFLSECPGGKKTADLIAEKLNAAARRTHNVKVDGIARKSINSILCELNPHKTQEQFVTI
jgi:hypothetical protein